MTRNEAITAMKAGKKVKHRYFSDHEWITMKGNEVVMEDGCRIDKTVFWQDRENKAFEIDWEIYEGK